MLSFAFSRSICAATPEGLPRVAFVGLVLSVRSSLGRFVASGGKSSTSARVLCLPMFRLLDLLQEALNLQISKPQKHPNLSRFAGGVPP